MVERDGSPDTALLAVWRDHHHLAKVTQSIDERPEPGRVDAIVVGDQYPANCRSSCSGGVLDCTELTGKASSDAAGVRDASQRLGKHHGADDRARH
jgi:hypothetical protein